MKNLTDINVVLDRSGSMHSIVADMQGGFDSFIKEQQQLKTDEATVSLYQFDEAYDVVYEGKPISAVPKLQLTPRGSTALHDAIGRTIVSVGNRLAKLDESERPNKVVVMIITDGGENASREYNNTQITKMIEHQETVYNWVFIFLGANQDAVKVGKSMGFNVNNSMTFVANSQGVGATYSSLSRNLTSMRATGVVQSMNFKETDRIAQVEATAPSLGLTPEQIHELKAKSRNARSFSITH